MIVIPGKIPKSCKDCGLKYHDEGGWKCLGMNIEDAETSIDLDNGDPFVYLPEWCPIQAEIPDNHGRLIDIDKFAVVTWNGIPDGYKDLFEDGALWLAEQIDEAPTVMQASESWWEDLDVNNEN